MENSFWRRTTTWTASSWRWTAQLAELFGRPRGPMRCGVIRRRPFGNGMGERRYWSPARFRLPVTIRLPESRFGGRMAWRELLYRFQSPRLTWFTWPRGLLAEMPRNASRY